MNELQVKTIELEPAKVAFNHEEIEKELEKNLQKYNGLTFTEDDATECRSTIAELRKGKAAVDRYRIDTKKRLAEPVTAFEKQCKDINKKIDDVIDPLVEQSDAFEEKRRNEKRERVQEIVARAIEDFELEEKYAVEMEISDKYLAKSKSVKSITEELETTAEHLKMKQDKEVSDKQAIIYQVKLSNTENDLNLSESSYLSLLDYKEINDITDQIMGDVEREVEKRNQGEKAKQEQDEQDVSRAWEMIKPKPFMDTEQDSINVEPEPDPFVGMDEPTVFEIYRATGTEAKLKALEEFMSENGISWEVMGDE